MLRALRIVAWSSRITIRDGLVSGFEEEAESNGYKKPSMVRSF